MGCETICYQTTEKIISPRLSVIIMEPELKEGNSKSSNQTYQKIKLIGEGSYNIIKMNKNIYL